MIWLASITIFKKYPLKTLNNSKSYQETEIVVSCWKYLIYNLKQTCILYIWGNDGRLRWSRRWVHFFLYTLISNSLGVFWVLSALVGGRENWSSRLRWYHPAHLKRSVKSLKNVSVSGFLESIKIPRGF